MRHLRNGCGVGVFLCLMGWLGGVEAYLLPPRHYLRKMVSVRSSMRQIRVWMIVETPKNGAIQREEAVLLLRTPGQIRFELHKDKKAHRIEVWRNQEHLSWEQGGQAKNQARKPNPRFDFFAMGGDDPSWA